MAPVITFIGNQGSGKKMLVSRVVAELKQRGYTVGVITSSSPPAIVFNGQETEISRFRPEGADSVLFVGPDQMVLQTGPSEVSIVNLAHRYFPEVDIVIGEGFENARKVPKMEVRRDAKQDLRRDVSGVIGVATNLDIAGDCIFRLDEAREIAQFLEKRFLVNGGRQPERVALLVDGRKIPLKPFVQDCLAGTIAGFIDSLKLTDGSEEIELRIRLNTSTKKKKQ